MNVENIDYNNIKTLTYRGKSYYIISNENNELVIADVTKKDQEIHIPKDTPRYEDIISGGSLEVEGTSNVYIIDNKPDISTTIEDTSAAITESDYESEVEMDELYYIAVDEDKGKHSTREVLLKEIKSRPKGIIPFMYLLLCYAYRNTTKHHYNAFDCGAEFKASTVKLKDANLDNFKEFKNMIESITKDEAPDFKDIMKVLPKFGKFHIITGLGGFGFTDNFNLTKKDCLMIVDELTGYLEGNSEANADELEDFE